MRIQHSGSICLAHGQLQCEDPITFPFGRGHSLQVLCDAPHRSSQLCYDLNLKMLMDDFDVIMISESDLTVQATP